MHVARRTRPRAGRTRLRILLAAANAAALLLLWWQVDGGMRWGRYRHRNVDFLSFAEIDERLAADEWPPPVPLPAWMEGIDRRAYAWTGMRPCARAWQGAGRGGAARSTEALYRRYAAEARFGDRLARFKLAAIARLRGRTSLALAILDRTVAGDHPLMRYLAGILFDKHIRRGDWWATRARAAAALRRGLALPRDDGADTGDEGALFDAAARWNAPLPAGIEGIERGEGRVPAGLLTFLFQFEQMNGREVFRLLASAAAAGCPEAALAEGMLLYEGAHVPRDPRRAALRFELARSAGLRLPPGTPAPVEVLRDPLECGNLKRLAFSPDGGTVVAAGHALVLRLDRRHPEQGVAMVTNPVAALAPDGGVALARAGDRLLILDTERRVERGAVETPGAWRTRDLRFSFARDGRHVWVGDRDARESGILDLAEARWMSRGEEPVYSRLQEALAPGAADAAAPDLPPWCGAPKDAPAWCGTAPDVPDWFRDAVAGARSPCGRWLATTDGLCVKVWDLDGAPGAPASPHEAGGTRP